MIASLAALASGVVALLAVGMTRPSSTFVLRAIAIAALGASAALLGVDGGTALLGADRWSAAWTVLFLAGGVALSLLIRDNDEIPFALAVGSVLGMTLLASSRTVLGLFVGLELMSLPAYVLVFALRRERPALEAATKYFFMGSAAAGIFLLGLAAAYGAVGSFELGALAAQPGAAAAAIALMGAAALFKIGAAPLHFWIPDVYEASRPELTGFLSTSMKAAGFLLLLRLAAAGAPDGPLAAALPLAAAVTMTAGNVLALRQSSLARLLAYSSIAHAGYVLVGVAAWARLGLAPEGVSAIWFYLAAYLATNTGVFAALGLAGLRTDADLRGLAKREPTLAALLSLLLISLAGVPPTAGFLAKLLILWDALEAGHVGLAVLLALNSLIGIGYYLRLVKLIWLEAPDETRVPAEAPAPTLGGRAVLWACAIPAIVLGAGPWAADAARRFLVK